VSRSRQRWNALNQLARILKANKIGAIVMCEDNVEFNTAEWILAGRRIAAAYRLERL
jgi:hypothetical protein